MRRFGRNVFRMAARNRGSFIGAVLIITIGIFIYIAMMDTLQNLEGQVERYYEERHLADGFAEVSGISREELSRLERLPGILKASGKMAEDIRLLGEGQEELVTVHLLSYDEEDALNRLSLSAPMETEDDLFLGGRMAGAYQYRKGEPLALLWGGERVEASFAGSCYAPDYIYSIPPGGSMIPDGEIYDIACMGRERMEKLVGRDTLNELAFSLEPGYGWEDVRGSLERELEGCGLISLTSREDQESCSMVDGEMEELMTMGTVLPALFMAISVFMLYVVLKKMIGRDQSLIGTMKAFGMTDGELLGAYLAEGAAVGGAGAILGGLLAAPFGAYMFNMYVDFFNLPDTVYHSYLGSRLSGLAIALATGLLAVFLGVRDILAIAPAQAMRAKAPKAAARGEAGIFKRLSGRLGPLEKMGLRSILRNPFRGFLIVLAVGFPFSMSSVLFSFHVISEQMYLNQFEKIEMYDLQASLDSIVSPVKARQGGEMLPGVERVEAVFSYPVELKNENLSEFAMLAGLNRGSELWRIMDNRGNYYEPPRRGLILNSRIAGKLHVKEGDRVEAACAGLTKGTVWLTVERVIEESLGSGCYISMEGIPQVFQTGPIANKVLLKAEPGRREEVKEALLNTSRVSWLVDAGKIVDSYRAMMGSMTAMIQMFALLSVASGGILIYNISMIGLRERVTEFGTLMVLGETGREIGRMLLFEQGVYFILGILSGIPGSFAMKALMEAMMASESYTIHMDVPPSSYGKAFLVCLGISLLSLAAELRAVGRVRLTDILKERE